MAKSIEFDSAQDEVCIELWQILQTAKNRTVLELTKPTVNKQITDDLIYLVSRAGTSYRYHAENPTA